MKKIVFSFIGLFFCLVIKVNAQIQNPGFENWTAGNPDYWATSNAIQVGLVNITQTTDKHGGTYALQGEVVSFYGTPMGPVIQSGPEATGFPISEKYKAIEMYYKFTSVEGDKFSVNVGFEKEGVAIAQGAVALPVNVDSYTYLSVPVEYFTDDIPDLANIQISITGPVTGSDYHVGSVMFVDDLAFSFATGITESASQNLTLNSYPNPASNILNILLDKEITGMVNLKVFNTSGIEVKTVTLNIKSNETLQLDVNEFPAGLYLYSLATSGKHFCGKFTVSTK